MSNFVWNSEIDYVDEANALASNCQLEFWKESLISLDLEKYFDDYPELKNIIGNDYKHLDYDSPNLEAAFSFIDNNFSLREQIYEDWIQFEAEALKDCCEDDLLRENFEHLDTLLDLSELNKTSLVGVYDGHLCFINNVTAEKLLHDEYSPYLEFVDTDNHSIRIDVEKLEFNEFRPNYVTVYGKDNYEDVEITLYTGRILNRELGDDPKLLEELKKYYDSSKMDDFDDFREEIDNLDCFLLKDIKEQQYRSR